MSSIKMDHNIERQRTHLQRRKISAAIKLERVHRYNVNEEVIEELEREYDTTVAQLKELERSTEARRRREIQTLRRYVTDTGIRYSLPEIDINYTTLDASAVAHPELLDTSDEDEDDAEEEEELEKPPEKKKMWKGLSWLNVSPFFRKRSGSDSGVSRAYRTHSADTLASHSTKVHLRKLYTGNSEFYDVEDPVDTPVNEVKSPESTALSQEPPIIIDPRALGEIEVFEQLIKNYFKRKLQKRC